MTLCSELDDDYETKEEQNARTASSPKKDGMVLTILEGLSAHMGWQFHLPEEMHEQIVVTIWHAKLFVNKENEAFEDHLVGMNKHIRKCLQPQRSSIPLRDRIIGLIFVLF